MSSDTKNGKSLSKMKRVAQDRYVWYELHWYLSTESHCEEVQTRKWILKQKIEDFQPK